VIRALLLSLVFAGSGLYDATQHPGQVVEEFCQLDLSGARLHSAEDAPIWRLTLDDGEPPESPVVIARGFHVAGAVEQGNEGTVTIQYQVLGVIGPDEVFTADSTRFATGRFHLKQQDGWKISLQSLKVPPHVSPEGYARHIDLLIQAINRKPPAKRNEARLSSLQKLKAQILALQ
jgi:hypothetical protein